MTLQNDDDSVHEARARKAARRIVRDEAVQFAASAVNGDEAGLENNAHALEQAIVAAIMEGVGRR